MHTTYSVHIYTVIRPPLRHFTCYAVITDAHPLTFIGCQLPVTDVQVTNAAHIMDTSGSKVARKELSMCKAVVPLMVQTVADRCIQAHGAMGLSQDTPLATTFLWARFLRLADGPCEVHWRTVAKLELKEQQKDNMLYKIGHYEPDMATVFRRPSDEISDHAKSRL